MYTMNIIGNTNYLFTITASHKVTGKKDTIKLHIEAFEIGEAFEKARQYINGRGYDSDDFTYKIEKK